MSSIIFIRNPDNTNAREFTVIVKPPPSIAGKLCNVRLLSAFVSDLYSVSDATSTQQDVSVAIEIYGFSTTQSIDTYTDQPCLLFGVLQNGLVARNQNMLVHIPCGPTLLKVKIYNTEFDWQRLRVSMPTPVSKTHGYSGLALMYRFETTSGTSLYDEVSRSYNATVEQGASLTTSTKAVGTSSLTLTASLDHSSKDYVQLPNITVPTGGFSLAFWFRGVAGLNTNALLLTLNNASSHTITLTASTNKYLELFVRGGVVLTNYAIISKTAINDNTWRHLAIVWNSSGHVYTYENGTESYKYTSSDVYPPAGERTTALIGRSNTTSQWSWGGGVDDFRVYNKALSLSEISELYSKDAKPSTCSLMLDCLPSPVNNM